MITSLSQLDMDATYTYADYLLWKFEERVELLRGHLALMAAPSRVHQGISSNLHRVLSNKLWKSTCKVYAAPFDVRLQHFSATQNKDITTVVQPDLCVICDPEKLDDRGCFGAPDLIIEIISPGNSRRELKDKYGIYQETGVLEYWIINPSEQLLQIYQLTEQGIYIGLRPYLIGDIVTTPIIPGLEVDLGDVFEV